MFSNTYQSGHYLQVWDSRVNPQKNPQYKQLFRKIPSSLKNFYDKEVKSYIYELQGNAKILFPYEDRQQLSLHQRYLVLQIFIPIGSSWSIQLGISDLQAQKKRINITTHTGKHQLKYFSFRYPLQSGALEKGVWSFVAIDIYSFCNAFKNTVFRSLDHITMHGQCKLRRIFTMKEWVQWQIPKNYWLSMNISQTLQLIQYKEEVYENVRHSINNSSIMQYSKMIQSRVQHIPAVMRHPQKSNNIHNNSQSPSKYNYNSPSKNINLNQNQSQNSQSHHNNGTVKLPQVSSGQKPSLHNNKQTTPMKSSKLSEKVQSLRNQYSKEFAIGKSNRSLTKADLVIEKSKIRLNSLQQKQEQILNRLKSEEKRLSDKITAKQKKALNNGINASKNRNSNNIFQSDLFKSEITQLSNSNLKNSRHSNSNKNHTPATNPNKLLVKVNKKFKEDNIFQEQSSYSSSISRKSYLQSHEESRSMVRESNNHNKFNEHHQKMIEDNQSAFIMGNSIIDEESNSSSLFLNAANTNFSRNKESKVSKGSTHLNRERERQRQQIIEEDVWTQEEQQQNEDVDSFLKPQTPIQEIIVDQPEHHYHQTNKGSRVISEKNSKASRVSGLGNKNGKTIITKQNNTEVILHDEKQPGQKGNELQLIYDEMVGCYYHPQTKTYYEIKN